MSSSQVLTPRNPSPPRSAASPPRTRAPPLAPCSTNSKTSCAASNPPAPPAARSTRWIAPSRCTASLPPSCRFTNSARPSAAGWTSTTSSPAPPPCSTDQSVAAWVLFRLDGGIDHILVDEAQDTSPNNGASSSPLPPNSPQAPAHATSNAPLFVVGDKKQSIYSFQGADVAAFDAKQTPSNPASRSATRLPIAGTGTFLPLLPCHPARGG
jgi:hypothetical protein